MSESEVRRGITEAADWLREAGVAMYGTMFVSRLADDLGIDQGTLRKWVNHRETLDWSHGIINDAERLLRDKSFAILMVANARRSA